MKAATIRRWWVVVLLALALLVFSGIGLAQCPVPPQYTNTTSTTTGDLHLVMAADEHHDTVGDPVQFYLSVSNSGTAPVVVPNPRSVTPIHSWAILLDTCQTAHDPEGCAVDSPFFMPQVVRQPPECGTPNAGFLARRGSCCPRIDSPPSPV